MFRRRNSAKSNPLLAATNPPTLLQQVNNIIEHDELTKLQDLINRKQIKADFRVGLEIPILCLAALHASEKIFNYLIEQLTDEQIAKAGQDGENALMAACMAGAPYKKEHAARLRMAGKLIEKGLDVNAADNSNVTAMHRAARYEFDDMIRLLLTHKASIDPADRLGRTPLFTLANTHKDSSSKDTMLLLCTNGANPDARTNFGHTAKDQVKNPLLIRIMNNKAGQSELLTASNNGYTKLK